MNAKINEIEKEIRKGKSSLLALQNELQETGITIENLFKYLRNKHLRKSLGKEETIFIEKVTGKKIDFSESIIPKEKINEIEKLIRKENLDWGCVGFHLKYRINSFEELKVLKISGEYEKQLMKDYNISIMPLNFIVENNELLNKFIPKKDFFTEHAAKKWDPYGIFMKKSRIVKDGVYLASQKYKRTILMNITSTCPIGCVGCYKGEFTRIVGKKFYTNLTKAVSVQSKKLVQHLNKNPEIKSVVLSGGEPLILPNSGIKKILKEFKKAKYLAEFRICTATIFQGLPFRIDDELLEMLSEFENETGIKVNFNAHLSHPAQFTPEALIAVRKIIRKGFPINSQIPLQRNVNFFIEDFDKTMNLIYELAELQGASGVRPYKYILHMNVGSLEYSVPLEFGLKVLGEMKYRLDHPLPETWQPVSFSILCQEGNILLSPQLIYLIKKKIDRKKAIVEYRIPVPIGNNEWKEIKYVEPLINGFTYIK